MVEYFLREPFSYERVHKLNINIEIVGKETLYQGERFHTLGDVVNAN